MPRIQVKFRYLFQVSKKYVPTNPRYFFKPPVEDWTRPRKYNFHELPRNERRNYSYPRNYADYYALYYYRFLKPMTFFGLIPRKKKNHLYAIAKESIPHRRGFFGVQWLWELIAIFSFYVSVVLTFIFTVCTIIFLGQLSWYLYDVFIYFTGLDPVIKQLQKDVFDYLEEGEHEMMDRKGRAILHLLDNLRKSIYEYPYVSRYTAIRDFDYENTSAEEIADILRSWFSDLGVKLLDALKFIKEA